MISGELLPSWQAQSTTDSLVGLGNWLVPRTGEVCGLRTFEKMAHKPCTLLVVDISLGFPGLQSNMFMAPLRMKESGVWNELSLPLNFRSYIGFHRASRTR